MRVLLTTRGSRGDVEPLAGLAVRLRSLGAEAAVLAPPDAEFAELLERVGVPHVPIGGSVRDLVTGKDPGQLKRLQGNLSAHAADLIEEGSAALFAEAERGCDAIVATGLFPNLVAGRGTAEKLGVPYRTAVFHSATLPSSVQRPHPRPGWPVPAEITDNRALWKRDIEVMNSLFGAPANAFRKSIGLAPVADVRDHGLTERPWLATDPLLNPWDQTEFQVTQTGAWFLPDERPLPAGLEAFLDAGEAPVYVGYGSMPPRQAEDAARAAVEAVRAHGRRLVLARGWAGLVPAEGEGDCFSVGEVNQQALFKRVAAVVHHGGAGTTHTATRSGTPQVVVPQIVDQPYWAGRVAELGCGAAHEGPVATAETLAAALAVALAPGTAARAADVAARIRTDGAAVAAELLLEAAA